MPVVLQFTQRAYAETNRFISDTSVSNSPANSLYLISLLGSTESNNIYKVGTQKLTNMIEGASEQYLAAGKREHVGGWRGEAFLNAYTSVNFQVTRSAAKFELFVLFLSVSKKKGRNQFYFYFLVRN